jgi:hypothetical protein
MVLMGGAILKKPPRWVFKKMGTFHQYGSAKGVQRSYKTL